MSEHGHILVVDDLRTGRLKLTLGLKQQGHTVAEAENGRMALERLRAEAFDLVLLDILMPEMDGYAVLKQMKQDEALGSIPVIIISAQDELESVVHGIELGAEDYLPKNFDPVLLKARIDACLEKKRLRDQERAYLRELQQERERSERLLLSLMPAPIAARLKKGPEVIADNFSDVSAMFIDIVDFTPLATQLPPAEVVGLLNAVFSTFDVLVDRYRLEKIKTSGDSYMVVGGAPLPRYGHLEAMADMALDVIANSAQFVRVGGEPFQFRVGLHAGPVTAGVIGTKRYIYDLWGDTINTASRMESHGLPGAIQTTQAVYERLQARYTFTPRGEVPVKGKGTLPTYLLTGRR